MNLLVIGGTVFLGRHIVRAAIDAGFKVTTFNRGTYQLAEQANIEQIRGDRVCDLHLLKGRHWDAVIDTCGMEAAVVETAVEFFAESSAKYVFVSSISAYSDFKQLNMTEKAPARILPPEQAQDYGSAKAECERIVSARFQKNALLIRPGLIVGPYDPTDRFTYWPLRISKGGKILAPGREDRRIQFIDVRDLSEWIIRLIAGNITGLFNATGPGFIYSMRQFLVDCLEVCRVENNLTWMSDEKLSQSDVKPWSELPLWIPESDKEFRGFMEIDCAKAQNKGLSYRSPRQTIEDTIHWFLGESEGTELKAGLSAERERELLERFEH
jgi:2'-hydroxyisoflavone reductase